MDAKTAAFLATTLSFVYFAAAARWYLVPWLHSVGRATALTGLLWVHAARHIAFQVYSAQQSGLAVPDAIRDQIAFGDALTSVLAFASIVMLRLRVSVAIPLVWITSLVGILDLINATAGGIKTDMLAHASGVTWLILNFYVPVLWIAHVLIVMELIRRRGETLDREP